MSALALVAGVALAVAIGGSVVRLLHVSPGAPWNPLLALGLGIGITSWTFFAAVMLGIGRGTYIALEGFLAAVLIAAALRLRPWTTAAWFSRTGGAGASQAGCHRTCAVLRAVAVLLILAAAAAFAARTWSYPHGTWDAIAIWNLRARFLAASVLEGVPFEPLPMGGARHGYPYLVPASAARLQVFAGGLTVAGPIAILACFTFGSLLLVRAVAGHIRSAAHGWLAMLLLLAAGRHIIIGAEQYADVPLGFFILAGIAVLLAAKDSENWRTAVLIGLLCGCAAWTKNEGLPFALAVALAAFVRCRRPVAALRWLAKYGLAVAPFVAAVLAVKIAAPDPRAMGGIERFFMADRIWLIATGMVRHAGPLVPALAAAAALGIDRERVRTRPVAAAALVLAMTSGAWVVYYFLTPSDLAWQLATSAGRLLIQVTPAIVLLVSLVSRDVDSVAAAGRKA